MQRERRERNIIISAATLGISITLYFTIYILKTILWFFGIHSLWLEIVHLVVGFVTMISLIATLILILHEVRGGEQDDITV